MEKKSGNVVLIGAGIALVVGFFLPWIDVGGIVGVSGWELLRTSEISLLTRLVFLAAPVGGVALILAGLGGGRAASNVAIGTGSVILGYTVYKVAYTFFKISGVGLWLVLAAGVIALIVGIATRAKKSA
jgi:hypothetical protein